MGDKIIDLRQGKKIGRKWFDIKKAISLSIGEKRKRWKLIKILNKATLVVMTIAIIVVGIRFLLKEKAKSIVFYDLIPDNLVSFSLINTNLGANAQVIGGVLDGITVFDKPFELINAELDAEVTRVLEEAKVNVENEIVPYLGENVGIVAVKTGEKYNFILFVELKGSLQDLSYAKSKIEKELQETYRLSYITHKGVSIASMENFDLDMGFSWLKGHYAFIDHYFILSDSVELLKQTIDKSY